jgi:hypothetical protein
MQTNASQRHSVILTLIALSSIFLFSAGIVQAQIQDRPKAGPEMKALEVFVGEWQYEGSVKDTPLGPGGSFSGKQTVKLILDGLFLEQRGEDKGVYGGKELVYQGVVVRWYDPVTKTYLDHGFDNDGFVGSGVMTKDGNTWIGNYTLKDKQGKNIKGKQISTFSSDGNTYAIKGQLSVDDGKTWTPYYEQNMKKVASITVEQEIIALENKWNEAMMKVDTKALNEILADEYIETGDKGNMSNKAKHISALKSGDLKVSDANLNDLKVKVYGNAAVVTGRNTTKEIFKGKASNEAYRITDTWVMQNNRWQCVASQWVTEEKKP